jgi:hypothetical protein
MAEHPSVSHVAGAVVHFSKLLEVEFGLVFIVDRPPVSKVLRSFGFEKTFTWPL